MTRRAFSLYRPNGAWVTTIKAESLDEALDKATDYARVLPGVSLDLHDENGAHVGAVLYKKAERPR